MTVPLEPRLEGFERRLRALEAELAELRALSVNGQAVADAEPAAPGEFDWAEALLARDDFRTFFRNVEQARRHALAADDLDTLRELSRLACLAEDRAPVGVESEAR